MVEALTRDVSVAAGRKQAAEGVEVNGIGVHGGKQVPQAKVLTLLIIKKPRSMKTELTLSAQFYP